MDKTWAPGRVALTNSARERLRVAHVVLQLDTGGMEKLLTEFARHADRDRFELRFVSMTSRGRVADELSTLGWPVEALGLPGGLRLRNVLRLASLFRKWQIDVAHFHNSKPLIFGGPAARLAGVRRTVYTRHGQRHLATRGQNALFRFASRFADDIVCVSKDSAECCLREGLNPERIRVVWNGIDLSRFSFTGPMQGGPLVMVGRLSREKDIGTLLRAIAIAHSRQPAIRLEIAGQGECRPELEKLATDLGLFPDVVRFLGTVDDVPRLLKLASMFVLSSLSEGISIAILEAMASGLPVVATEVGGNPELVRDGHTGYLVSPSDPGPLAEAILKVWDNPASAHQMGRDGHHRAEAHFNASQMVATYERLYRGNSAANMSNQRALCGA